ncbi:MAG: prepilin-type N-terminal cleavage/methylation domain-containing protein [Bacillota bacterium]|nr:prepilin-type N-terminal cleavage/methylation domain-containing protein [Bacillota bacterium]
MRRKGLTLVEILLSVAIISISAITIVKVFVSADTLNNRTAEHERAVFEAVTLMEQISYHDIAFLFTMEYDGREFDFAEGFEKKTDAGDNASLRLEKLLGNDLIAVMAILPGRDSISVTIDMLRDQDAIYQLRRTFYRRFE